MTEKEYFNKHKDMTLDQIAARVAAIEAEINNNPDADINELNAELKALKQVKENIEERSKKFQPQNFNPLTFQNMGATKKKFDENVLDEPEYRTAFYKTLLGQKLNDIEVSAYKAGRVEMEKRDDAFTTSTTGAAVIPTATLNEIVSTARGQSGLLAHCRAFAVPTKIAVPVSTPSQRAAWHAEGAAVDSEAVTPTNVVFDGFELLKVFSLSAKAKKMSVSAFESYLTEELRASVFEAIDYALINGTGSGEPLGLLNAITWDSSNSVIASNGLKYTDIAAAAALLKKGYANGAKIAMSNKTLYSQIYTLVDTNKRPIFIADTQNETVGKILGFEVVIDDNIPDDTMILGDISHYLGYNLPEGIIIEASRDSSFKKGLIDFRALAIADCKVIAGEAFVKISA